MNVLVVQSIVLLVNYLLVDCECFFFTVLFILGHD